MLGLFRDQKTGSGKLGGLPIATEPVRDEVLISTLDSLTPKPVFYLE